VVDVDPLALGLAAVAMGAGRTRADQAVDPVVGIELAVAPGDGVDRGSVLAVLHVRDAKDVEAVRARVAGAFTVADRAPLERPLVLGAVR
jgi:pyrimidine-nucleoside phosphorylase